MWGRIVVDEGKVGEDEVTISMIVGAILATLVPPERYMDKTGSLEMLTFMLQDPSSVLGSQESCPL